MTTLPLDHVGIHGPDRPLLGINMYGAHLIHDRANPAAPHIQISGSTGGGKGGTLKPLLCHDLQVGNTVVILQPKPGEFGWTEGAATLVTGLEQYDRAMTWGVKQMESRQTAMANWHNHRTNTRGVAHFTHMGQDLPRIVFYIDEVASVIGTEAALDKDEKKIVERVAKNVAKIARLGRSAGVHLIIVTQRPTLDGTFAESGGVIQANLKGRIHFDRDAISLQHAFGNGSGITTSVLRQLEMGGPGRCIYSHLDPAQQGRPLAGQIWWLTDEQCRPFAERYDGPEPMNFDTDKATRTEVYAP